MSINTIVLIIHVIGGLTLLFTGFYLIIGTFFKRISRHVSALASVAFMTFLQIASGITLYFLHAHEASVFAACSKVALYLIFSSFVAFVVFKDLKSKKYEFSNAKKS